MEGVQGIMTKKINIFPDVPMKMDLSLSKAILEANGSDSVGVRVELKDRYGNLVFTDSTTKAILEIKNKYSQIIQAS